MRRLSISILLLGTFWWALVGPCEARGPSDEIAALAKATWQTSPPPVPTLTPAATVRSAATGLDITGPAETQRGEEVELIVTGATLAELIEARRDGRLDLTFWPQDGADVDPGYDWLSDEVELEFRAAAPGKYLVKLILVRDCRLETAEVRITVTGEVPPPNPYPPPAAELRRLVEPVTRLQIEPVDAKTIGELYAGLALAVEAAPTPEPEPTRPKMLPPAIARPLFSPPPPTSGRCSLNVGGRLVCKGSTQPSQNSTTKFSPKPTASRSARSSRGPMQRFFGRLLGQ